MAKSFKCPNCGGASRENLSDTQFRCIHCETIFYDTSEEEIKRAVEEELKKKGNNRNAMPDSFAYARSMRRNIFIIVITFMLLGMGLAFYIVQKTFNEIDKQTDKIENDVNESLKESGVKK